MSDHFSHFLPPISLIRDFSNQNARGNVSTTSVNRTDDIPYVEMFPFIASEFQIRELNLPRRVVYLFQCVNSGLRMLLDFFVLDNCV